MNKLILFLANSQPNFINLARTSILINALDWRTQSLSV